MGRTTPPRSEARRTTALLGLAIGVGLLVTAIAGTFGAPVRGSPPSAAQGPAAAFDSDRAANLAAAQELLALQHSGATPVGLAKAASLAQLRLLGLEPVTIEAPRHTSPSLAAAAIVARFGADPPLDVQVRLAALDALPAEVRGALAGVLDAFLAYDGAVREGFADARLDLLPRYLGHDDRTPITATEAGIDVARVVSARLLLLDAGQALKAAFAAHPTPVAQAPIQIAPVLSISLGASDDTYTQNFALSLDEAGHDVYYNNAGGNNLAIPSDGCLVSATVAGAAMDFAGHDQYVSGRNCGINGGGTGGSGLLWDAAGDDLYRAGSDGTDGGALLGVGFLLDESGQDIHDVTGWGTTGGGFPAGVGFLLDGAGDDSYTTWWEATNGGGSVGGAGFMYEAGGNDVYVAQWGGTNGGSEFGRGFLLDAGGDDSYTAENGGVNGGGMGGPGFLYDAAGSDVYLDLDGGSGTDITLVPKVHAGAQIDA